LAPPTLTLRRPALRPFTDLQADHDLAADRRVAQARAAKLDTVKELFRQAGLSFPPAELLLRGFKQERELEVWASDELGAAMQHVTTYEVCAASGHIGPKRREGDRQVPEGFYKISYLWPNSAFYLSMRVSYPNPSDRILGHKTTPGSDIMIHGGCASIGCLAMSDERIQELWVMAEPAHQTAPIRVHILPTRKRDGLASHPLFPRHGSFWQSLYRGADMFDESRRPPGVKVLWDGRYAFETDASG
jgi:murein L,D-transpeptidase YafK